MIGKYDVYLGKQIIGTAKMERQGLYWHVVCQCTLSGKVMHKLELCCGKSRIDLGILIPEGEDFVLDTRFPAKRLGGGTPEFSVIPRHSELRGKFIPIYPEEPFAYLERLKQAHLEIRKGQPGIVLCDD